MDGCTRHIAVTFPGQIRDQYRTIPARQLARCTRRRPFRTKVVAASSGQPKQVPKKTGRKTHLPCSPPIRKKAATAGKPRSKAISSTGKPAIVAPVPKPSACNRRAPKTRQRAEKPAASRRCSGPNGGGTAYFAFGASRTTISRSSVMSSIAYLMPSRPSPESFTPP